MKKYDFIFGIGRACACSQALRRAGLQLLSLPWDWITINTPTNSPDLPTRMDIMEAGFVDWLREEDLEFVSLIATTGKAQYRNRRLGIVYPHDFPRDVPLHESYPVVKGKYDRRVDRFKRLMAASRTRVLAVYVDSPTAAKADVAVCRETQRRLQSLYPHVKVDFLQISLEEDRLFSDRTVEELGDDFVHVSFDFRDLRPGKFDFSVELDKLAAVMKSVASVREYRSPAEIKAMNERTHREKMREQGAKNAWEYFLIRRRREMRRLRECLSPCFILARLRKKRFDHVFSLGMNCEPAYRFTLSWGFVDSTPFSWGLSKNPQQLAELLANPENVGGEGFEWDPDLLLWRCVKTGLLFHGRRIATLNEQMPSEEVLDADKADLTQRLAHLFEKFARVMADDSSKALVYRIHTKLVQKPDINEKLDAIQRALEAHGARNYTFVVVTERAVRGRVKPAPHRIVRSVKIFNPGESVVKEHLGDPLGWRALYAEIVPAKILPKNHAFKFEGH